MLYLKRNQSLPCRIFKFSFSVYPKCYPCFIMEAFFLYRMQLSSALKKHLEKINTKTRYVFLFVLFYFFWIW